LTIGPIDKCAATTGITVHCLSN